MRTNDKARVVFIAKTNLNNDGRILNELKILKNRFHDKLWIDFILMPDKPLVTQVNEVDRFYVVDTAIRGNAILRFMTVLEFTFKAFSHLVKLKPDMIHAQDTAIVLPVFFYKLLKKKKVKVIYDDHELPNEKEPLQMRFLQRIENRLFRLADHVIVANKERQEYLKNQFGLDISHSSYFLNLPYFESDKKDEILEEVKPLVKIKQEQNWKFIMHQGIIEKERGRDRLAEFSKILPNDIKVLIVGVSKEYFQEFVEEYGLDYNNFYFVGSVPYYILNDYWGIADASIVMYMPKYINNRLCAPNRLYISFKNSMPIIVNKDNPVLSSFIIDHKCGVFIETLNSHNIRTVFDVSYEPDGMKKLISSEIEKLESIYSKVLFS